MDDEQRKCVSYIARRGGMLDHDDRGLDRFCNPKLRIDVFNECHDFGWLSSVYDALSDTSIVYITDAGRAALKEG